MAKEHIYRKIYTDCLYTYRQWLTILYANANTSAKINGECRMEEENGEIIVCMHMPQTHTHKQ